MKQSSHFEKIDVIASKSLEKNTGKSGNQWIAIRYDEIQDGRKRNWAREHWKNVIAELLKQIEN